MGFVDAKLISYKLLNISSQYGQRKSFASVNCYITSYADNWRFNDSLSFKYEWNGDKL